MRIVETPDRLPEGGLVLVPTMGGLHEGHLQLVRRGVEIARERGLTGGCVVSVFVNPTQFDEAYDYERYPRMVEKDAAMCAEVGASAVFAPSVETVYPTPESRRDPVMPQVAYEPKLEDAARRGHFAGVCLVCRRLFELTGASVAVFGEKDWQQLQTVRAMVRMLRSEVEVVGCPTVRDPDGLAMSSRNRFLSDEDRQRGLALSRGLRAAGREATPEAGELAMRRVLREAGVTPDYAAIREASTLMPPAPDARPEEVVWRAVVAGRVGSVRLLDNMPWPLADGA
ncbi:MAG: 4-phosphopantoate--beta-alanine ligase [Phycisphaerales bacterium JB059]